ncbi:ATP-binding cassette domain-containing protein [Arenibaculum sp.]|jgi:putative thiamine transport system ATP-binding protein|uniref:ATP-binding cassette domain-containing protein n=1 Tax=Arenibaculum sp. TaxID=2865862 RepID=UPI002E13A5C0|nr:ATP-binding cassette domain-containing protein [Arenibaculum sp.]
MRGLALHHVSLWIDGHRLLGPLDLAIEPGTVAVLTGPSGSGKSSLLAWLCGTLDPAIRAEGRVTLDGRDIGTLAPEHRRVGILFQDDLLFPHMSVAENLSFGLPAGLRGGGRTARIDEALALAGLAGFGPRDPATLSGGQRARVALLRMLLAEPQALLLDEPFSKLDPALRSRLRSFVFDHARSLGLATLLVTHDPADAREADGPVIDLSGG